MSLDDAEHYLQEARAAYRRAISRHASTRTLTRAERAIVMWSRLVAAHRGQDPRTAVAYV